mgnify:CR=1 FL=1|tara:strand:- start:2279 stop:2701 length:423 start_codon:yes stop_codon:yes gene_type:complete
MTHHDLEKNIIKIAHFLKEDNILLEKFKEQEVLDRIPEKNELMAAYTESYHRFRENLEMARNLSKEIKQKLIYDLQELERLSQKNHDLVKRFLGAHEFYVKTITRVTRDTIAPKVEGYSALGRYSEKASSLPAMSINQCT